METSTVTTVAAEAVAVAPKGRRPRRARRYTPQSRFAPAWLLTPAGIIVIALILVPIGFLIYTSFTNYDQRSLFTGEVSGVGFHQYTSTLGSSQFWSSTLLTLWFTAALVGGSLVVGVGVSELMMLLGKRMRYVVTLVLIFAWAMPTVAATQVWNWLFEPGFGVVNWLLTQLHIFGNLTNEAWNNNKWLALFNIWLLVVWQAVPFIAFTTYAARSQVDTAMIEAARIDGASELRIYVSIILNSLRPTILLVALLSVIWDFNLFNQVWLISQGGPNNSTATLGIWTYLSAFTSFQIGTGAAISVLTTIMLLVLSGFYIRRLLRAGEDL
jgi:N,N'-diacetylchitobiose transport system permease protein